MSYKMCIQIIITRAQKPVLLTAGKFSQFTLEEFNKVTWKRGPKIKSCVGWGGKISLFRHCFMCETSEESMARTKINLPQAMWSGGRGMLLMKPSSIVRVVYHPPWTAATSVLGPKTVRYCEEEGWSLADPTRVKRCQPRLALGLQLWWEPRPGGMVLELESWSPSAPQRAPGASGQRFGHPYSLRESWRLMPSLFPKNFDIDPDHLLLVQSVGPDLDSKTTRQKPLEGIISSLQAILETYEIYQLLYALHCLLKLGSNGLHYLVEALNITQDDGRDLPLGFIGKPRTAGTWLGWEATCVFNLRFPPVPPKARLRHALVRAIFRYVSTPRGLLPGYPLTRGSGVDSVLLVAATIGTLPSGSWRGPTRSPLPGSWGDRADSLVGPRKGHIVFRPEKDGQLFLAATSGSLSFES
ncbi:unnamed protein product [Timema podura]|uniref:Uncharacterized protein n=1 Tax=Timema podura TaxID=61482 RepID=A0ABN7NTU7_TIMPD|nr:unnamed protein product [Timema podura]